MVTGSPLPIPGVPVVLGGQPVPVARDAGECEPQKRVLRASPAAVVRGKRPAAGLNRVE